jgi:PKD repeat protein
MEINKLLQRAILPGKILLLLAAFFAASFTADASCVKANFKFKVDHNSKKVSFKSETSGRVLAYKWSFGDRNTSILANPTHQYANSGDYKVCLTVYGWDSTNNKRCSTTVCKKVEIVNCRLFKADFDYEVSGLTVKLKGKANADASFAWLLGSATNTKTGSEIKITFPASGTYNICLIAKSDKGACITKVCKKITVKACDLSPKFEYRLDGTVLYVAGKTNSNNTVAYYTVNGQKTIRGLKGRTDLGKYGKFKICLVVKDTTTGCTDRTCEEVEIECKLEAKFEYRVDSNTLYVAGRTNSKNTIAYYLVNGKRAIKGLKGRTNLPGPGRYKVCLYVKDTVTDCSVTKCQIVEVKCDLKVGFVYEEVDGKIVVRGKSNSRNAVYWYELNNRVVVKGQVGKFKLPIPGSYRLCLVAKDTVTGCVVRDCKKVEVDCRLKADFTYVIDGKGVKLKARANGDNLHYFWSFGNGKDATGKTTGIRYDKEGTYEICLIVFNPRTKCKVCVCKKIKIEKPCRLKADFRFRVDGDKVYFKGRSNASDAVYKWRFGDGNDASGQKVRNQYKKKGVYRVTMTVYSRKHKCNITITKRVVIGLSGKSALLIEPNDDSIDPELDGKADVRVGTKADWSASVSPSPAKNQVKVTADAKEVARVIVYDNTGNRVIVEEGQFNEIDIAKLRAGFYYAHVFATDGTVKVVKFLKD